MPTAHYNIGEDFPLQFAWRLPNDDYLRAVFLANVLDLVPDALSAQGSRETSFADLNAFFRKELIGSRSRQRFKSSSVA